jgi:hypothetical protein
MPSLTSSFDTFYFINHSLGGGGGGGMMRRRWRRRRRKGRRRRMMEEEGLVVCRRKPQCTRASGIGACLVRRRPFSYA